jgi:alpha-L-rhamnosidase
MVRGTISGVLVFGFVLSSSTTLAQQQPDKAWSASWIDEPTSEPAKSGVYHFRKDFELAQQPASFPIRVSADNRYRLYVNGVEVSNGPARGDLLHWRYEALDIAAHLHAGRNAIAALVWNMGEFKPAAQISLRTALVVQGDSPEATIVSTGASGWKVFASHAYTFKRVEGADTGGFYVAGPREELDARQVPWGWERLGFDASGWVDAKPIVQQFASPVALARGTQVNGSAAEWQLVARNIPLPEQTPVRFASVRRAEGVTVPEGFAAGKQALTVPPRTKATLLLDQGALTVGYPVMVTTGGAGAKATIIYAESLFDAAGNKGNRSEIEGKTIRGLRDTIRFDGGEGRRFQSLWLRTWRYVEVEIETGDQPLRIDSVEGIFAAYPFKQRAAFDSDAKWIKPIWDMNWRALRMSAFETFWDTPYYEQLQYVGDTRIEALMSVYQTGDDRLMRNAIEQFDDSRTSEGLTASSYPSSLRQQIPPFSLWWISMVHDYWILRDDPTFVRGRMQGVRDVLDWFEWHVDEAGLLGPMPWWNYLDWAKSYPNGVPPGGGKGHSVAINLQFVLALQQAAEMEQALDRPGDAKRYIELANRIIATLRAKAWDGNRGLFVDSLETRSFSQQANALAILARAVPDGMEKSVAEKMLADKDLEPATFYFRFYVDEAMRSAGLADRYLSRLGPWQEMIRNGMTTTAETPEPTRSDSHAWAAHPNYQLLATVLGIRPAAPGFKRVAITPALGNLKFAEGQMPHPEGEIRASYRQGKDKLFADVTLPLTVSGEFVWRSARLNLRGGKNSVVCKADQCRPVEAGNLRPVAHKGE